MATIALPCLVPCQVQAHFIVRALRARPCGIADPPAARIGLGAR